MALLVNVTGICHVINMLFPVYMLIENLYIFISENFPILFACLFIYLYVICCFLVLLLFRTFSFSFYKFLIKLQKVFI